MGLVMTMPRISYLTLAVLTAMTLLDPAQAVSPRGTATEQQWGAMDRCTKRAIATFPDHTAEALVKRDEFARRCQRQAGFPVREGLAPK
jgi:hypothetical protein